VTHGRTEECGGLLKGTDARIHHYLSLGTQFTAHFIDKRRHTIDAGIATRNDTHRLPLLVGIVKGQAGTVALLLHTGIDTAGPGLKIRFYKLEIVFVTYDNVAPAQGFDGSRSDVLRRTRANAYNIYLHYREKLVSIL
jgi:hypothetical protein